MDATQFQVLVAKGASKGGYLLGPYQDRIDRAWNDAALIVGGRTPAMQAIAQEIHVWRRLDIGGHKGWALAGVTPDGAPYSVNQWVSEGRALDARLSAEAGTPFDPTQWPVYGSEERDASGRVSGATAGGFALAGLLLALLA